MRDVARTVSRYARRAFIPHHAGQEMDSQIQEESERRAANRPSLLLPETYTDRGFALWPEAERSLRANNAREPASSNPGERQNDAETNIEPPSPETRAEPHGQNGANSARVGSSTNNPARSLTTPLPNAWQHLENINLSQELRLPVSTLEDVPYSIRSEYKRIRSAVYKNLSESYRATGELNAPERLPGQICLAASRLTVPIPLKRNQAKIAKAGRGWRLRLERNL